VRLSTSLRHLKLHILMFLCIRKITMPRYFLQICLEFLFSSSQKGLGHTNLNVFGNTRLKHHMPQSRLRSLHLYYISATNLCRLSNHRYVQGSQFFKKCLFQTRSWPYSVSEYGLYDFFRLLCSSTCG
jgi:hypothetical protein